MQALVILILIGFIIFELQYFGYINISHCIKSSLYALQRSENYLYFLFSSLGLVIVALYYLKNTRSDMNNQKLAYTFSKKKSLTAYKKELIRETRRNVDALLNSEAYKRHRQQYETTQDFLNERHLSSDDEVSIDYDDLSSDSNQ